MRKLLTYIIPFFLMINFTVHAEQVKTIRFATEATYPPFEYVNEEGEIKGFDIDIAKALCKQMKAECTFSNQSFSSLIPSLMIGKFDALISALGVTAEREKQVSFTNSYYEPSASFAALTAKHYSLSALQGMAIGVQQSSTYEKYLQVKYGSKITIKTYASIQEAFLDLVAGRVDAVLADTPITDRWLKDNKLYTMIDKPIIDHTYFGSGYGIAVNKGNPDLLSALNQALAEIRKNGTYLKITKQYF